MLHTIDFHKKLLEVWTMQFPTEVDVQQQLPLKCKLAEKAQPCTSVLRIGSCLAEN